MNKIFFIISIALMNGLFAFSQSKKIDVYEFPIESGTEKWWQFETVEKRVEASGSELAAGMYLYALIVDGKLVETKQMVLTK